MCGAIQSLPSVQYRSLHPNEIAVCGIQELYCCGTLILLPMVMRALMGEGAKELRSELPAFVRNPGRDVGAVRIGGRGGEQRHQYPAKSRCAGSAFMVGSSLHFHQD